MVYKKDKLGVAPQPTRTITVSDVRIADGIFVDEEGNVADKVAALLPSDVETFKFTIKLHISNEEVDE